MSRQTGFTLIELIVVIVLLGILAATALPKYSGIQTGGRVSIVNGGRAAVLSGMNISSAAQQSMGLASNVDVVLDGVSISMVGGFPVANLGASGIFGAAGLSVDYSAVCDPLGCGVALSSVVDIQLQAAPNPSACSFSYTAARVSGTIVLPPRVAASVTSGC